MTPRKKVKPTYPDNWEVSEEFVWNRRKIVPGTELSITGIRGRCRFIKHIVVYDQSAGSQRKVKFDTIDVFDRNKRFRVVSPKRIRTVHRIEKTRENAKRS